MPDGPVVQFHVEGGGTDGGARAALAVPCARALEAFTGNDAGRAVLSRMGLARFVPASERDYEAVAALMQAGAASRPTRAAAAP